MPIVSLEGPKATRIRKKNEYATWGSRNQDNRVEPIANPAFEVPFKLKPGEPIFTIGSCFARHVEGELVDRGFRIPMRELFKQPEFAGLPVEIVNNFGTPSIFNELAWAFGEREFDESLHVVEVSKDKYVDLHMVNSVRPSPIDVVRERRRGLIQATRQLAECRVLIVTLGLVELWWDDEAQCYLNTGPLPSVLKKWPKRFFLHVLSFEECYDYLRRALDIAFAHSRTDLRVILTVSPVPMMATHRNIDVISANSYSKSVLRAVAEHIVATDNRTSYFPSFETVSMSDRRISWSDDFVHVNRPMVELNIARMVSAFTGQADSSAAILSEMRSEEGETADALLLAEKARVARYAGDTDFFDTHIEAVKSSSAFAIEYTHFLFDQERFSDVIAVTEGDNRNETQVLRARALIGMGQPEAALGALQSMRTSDIKGNDHWRISVDAAVNMKSQSALIDIETEWLAARPRSKWLVHSYVGRAFRVIGELELAAERLVKAASHPDRNDATAIECATVLVALKQFTDAADVLNGVVGNTDWQSKRIERLQSQISNAVK